MPRIIVSNGFGQFPLRLAAAEMASRDVLAAFITGGYPTPALARRGRSGRAGGGPRDGPLSRPRPPPVPAGCVHALWAGEPFSQVASRVRGVSAASRWTADRLHLLAPRTLRGRGVPHRREIGAGARPGDLPLPVRLRRRLGGRRTPGAAGSACAITRSPIRRCWSTSPPMRAACRPRGSRVRSTGIGAPSWRTSIAPITCSPGPIS